MKNIIRCVTTSNECTIVVVGDRINVRACQSFALRPSRISKCCSVLTEIIKIKKGKEVNSNNETPFVRRKSGSSPSLSTRFSGRSASRNGDLARRKCGWCKCPPSSPITSCCWICGHLLAIAPAEKSIIC